MLTLDLRNLEERRVGAANGVDVARETAALGPHLDAAADALLARAHDDGAMLGWIAAPRDPAPLDAVQAFVDARRGAYDDVVVLGIGGSALGARAVQHALRPPLAPPDADGPRVHVLDNVDGDEVAAYLAALRPERTLVNVISKSGTTAETMAGYLAFEAWLRRGVGEAWREHVVVTTDPERGILGPRAAAYDLPRFDVPPSVGGRFSVLTPVGLLPAAWMGVDVAALLRGADRVLDDVCTPTDGSVAKRLAAAHVWAARRGKTQTVWMPYASGLRRTSDWFVQLWAESLGKAHTRDGARVHAGTTPIPAVGATDQHAQVQLFAEGPNDKLTTFVVLDDDRSGTRVPDAPEGLEPLGYLGGRRFHEVLNAEAAATAHALAVRGRPSITLRLPHLDAETFGALLQTTMWQTALVGEIWNVDAFDQPGVELGKRYTYALMGRDGFDDERAALRDAGVEAP